MVSEQSFRLFVESVIDYAIFMLDPEGNVTSWNPGAQRIKGYRAEEIIGRHFSTFYPPEDVRAGKPERELAIARRDGHVEDEGWRVRKDGSRFWADVVITALHDAHGNLTGFGKVTRDLTERMRAVEDSARLQEEQYARAAAEEAIANQRFLSEAGAVLGSTLDVDTVMRNLSRLAVPRLGDWCAIDLRHGDALRLVAVAHVDPAKVRLAWDLRARFPPRPDDRTGPAAVIRTGKPDFAPDVTEAMIDQGVPDPAQRAIIRELGIRSAMTVPLNTRGITLGALTLVTAESGRHYERSDLTFAEELAQRAALSVHNAQLFMESQAAIHVRDEFLSVAGHELRTPVAALTLQTEGILRLADRGEVTHQPDRVIERLRKINRHVARLARLVDELLDVSRITSGRLELHKESLDLSGLVKEVLERFADHVAQARSPVHFEGEPLLGQWDRSRVDQVVSNLLSNAIKYGAGQPIDLSVGSSDGMAAITVRDRGIGIEPAQRERIFGRFERAVSERNYGGLGLGLWIVRQIVLAHGGEVSVQSEPGQGASFRVVLPLS